MVPRLLNESDDREGLQSKKQSSGCRPIYGRSWRDNESSWKGKVDVREDNEDRDLLIRQLWTCWTISLTLAGKFAKAPSEIILTFIPTATGGEAGSKWSFQARVT